jgi:hypothetical protein
LSAQSSTTDKITAAVFNSLQSHEGEQTYIRKIPSTLRVPVLHIAEQEFRGWPQPPKVEEEGIKERTSRNSDAHKCGGKTRRLVRYLAAA